MACPHETRRLRGPPGPARCTRKGAPGGVSRPRRDIQPGRRRRLGGDERSHGRAERRVRQSPEPGPSSGLRPWPQDRCVRREVVQHEAWACAGRGGRAPTRRLGVKDPRGGCWPHPGREARRRCPRFRPLRRTEHRRPGAPGPGLPPLAAPPLVRPAIPSRDRRAATEESGPAPIRAGTLPPLNRAAKPGLRADVRGGAPNYQVGPKSEANLCGGAHIQAVLRPESG